MTQSVAEIIAGISPPVTGLSMRGPRAIVPIAESTGIAIHRDRLSQSGELLLTATDGSAASLEDLATNVQSCAVGAYALVLLARAVDEASPESIAEAIAGAGAEFLMVTDTGIQQFPAAALVRRTGSPDETAIDALATALAAGRTQPEGAASPVPVAMDAEARARLDRVRAETARLRVEVRAAQARAEKAERALARVEASTSLRVGKRLVEAAKSPRSTVTLPRDVWRMWRLRSQRRRSATAKQAAASAAAPASRPQAAASGSHLLSPRATATTPLGQLSIVAVISDAGAAALAPYCAVTRVLPHNAAAVMERIDADLVLIETDAAQPPSPWAHLGDPSATDRELALVELVDVAHAQGRPVVLVRSGDPSRSAMLHGLAERCDLVLTSCAGIDHTAWNVGIDLAAAWLPAGNRSGAVFVGQCDARWSTATRDAVTAALRAADRAYIHDWTSNVSRYAATWPSDLSACIAAPIMSGDIVGALDGRMVGIADPTRVARGLLHPTTAAMLAGALRIVTPDDVNLDGYDSVLASYSDPVSAGEAMRAVAQRGPVTADEHRHVLRELYLHHATPVMLQRLVEALGLNSRPLASRELAVVASVDDSSAESFTGAVLAQRVRPAEVILTADRTPDALDHLRAAGIAVHRIGSDAGAERIGQAVDSPYAVSVDEGEWQIWPDTHLLDIAIDLEVGFEEVSS